MALPASSTVDDDQDDPLKKKTCPRLSPARQNDEDGQEIDWSAVVSMFCFLHVDPL